MKAYYAIEQKRHDPKAFLSSGAPQPNPEQPERAERPGRLRFQSRYSTMRLES